MEIVIKASPTQLKGTQHLGKDSTLHHDNNNHDVIVTSPLHNGINFDPCPYLLSGDLHLTLVLQEQPQHRLHQGRDVHLQLVAHGNHDLLNEQNDGILDGTGWTPELLWGRGRGRGR